MTGLLKIVSVAKSTSLNPPSNDLHADPEIVYKFEIVYGTESFQVTKLVFPFVSLLCWILPFQIRKNAEELRQWISTANETFPSLKLQNHLLYQESTQSFVVENVQTYLNDVFEFMDTDNDGKNLFQYPKLLSFVDPAIESVSDLVRISLMLQNNKVSHLKNLFSYSVNVIATLRLIVLVIKWTT
jgi:hypothetical protein